jgi:predicted Zn-dependent peptidase
MSLVSNELFNEIRRMRDERVPDSELDDSRRAIVAEFALSLESAAQLMNYEITRRIYGLPTDYWDTYPAKVSAITIRALAKVLACRATRRVTLVRLTHSFMGI